MEGLRGRREAISGIVEEVDFESLAQGYGIGCPNARGPWCTVDEDQRGSGFWSERCPADGIFVDVVFVVEDVGQRGLNFRSHVEYSRSEMHLCTTVMFLAATANESDGQTMLPVSR